jgi:hypothetical protein
MSAGADMSALYREFTDVLTEVLAENAIGLAVSLCRSPGSGKG